MRPAAEFFFSEQKQGAFYPNSLQTARFVSLLECFILLWLVEDFEKRLKRKGRKPGGCAALTGPQDDPLRPQTDTEHGVMLCFKKI